MLRSRHLSVSEVVVLSRFDDFLELLQALLSDENVVRLQQISQVESLRLFDLNILQVLCG